jgi:hypothetical protein
MILGATYMGCIKTENNTTKQQILPKKNIGNLQFPIASTSSFRC